MDECKTRGEREETHCRFGEIESKRKLSNDTLGVERGRKKWPQERAGRKRKEDAEARR
jgi:hypothetical protein